MPQIYTIVLNTRESKDPDGDTMSWAATFLDTEVMRVRGLFPSVLQGNTILRVETDLQPDDYLSHAFQGGLNAEMREPSSDVIWWGIDHHRTDPLVEAVKAKRGQISQAIADA